MLNITQEKELNEIWNVFYPSDSHQSMIIDHDAPYNDDIKNDLDQENTIKFIQKKFMRSITSIR